MAEARTPYRTSSRFWSHWLPVLAYLALIFILSAQPNLQPPVHFADSDKVMHLGEYAVLGALLARALRVSNPAWSALTIAFAAVALSSLWGASDEYHQSFVPGRDSSAYDWCADTMGALLAQCVRAGFAGVTED